MFREYEDADYYGYDENGVKYVTTPDYDYVPDMGMVLVVPLIVQALVFLFFI